MVGYQLFNRIAPVRFENEDKFWYFRSPICVVSNESLAAAMYAVEGVIYSGLTAYYVYLGYQIHKLKADRKYLTHTTYIIPPLLAVVAFANMILVFNKSLSDTSDTPMSLLQVLLSSCITATDVYTFAGLMAKVLKQKLALSRFASTGALGSKATKAADASNKSHLSIRRIANAVNLSESIAKLEVKALGASKMKVEENTKVKEKPH